MVSESSTNTLLQGLTPCNDKVELFPNNVAIMSKPVLYMDTKDSSGKSV